MNEQINIPNPEDFQDNSFDFDERVPTPEEEQAILTKFGLI